MQKLRNLNFSAVCGVALIAMLGFNSCSTEVDLIAPYESSPVVFGLLDAEVDTQWVRINRTWLGEGDQTVFALIPDSSEYDNSRLSAQFVEVVNGVDNRVFQLVDTMLDNKEEDGVFFAPEYKAYFARTTANNGTKLDEEAEYRLELVIDDTVEVEAVTNLVQSELGSIFQPPSGIFYEFNLANIGPSEVTYPEQTFKWYSTDGAARYDAMIVVHYKENYYADDALTILDSSRVKTMEIMVGSEEPNDTDGGEVVEEKWDSQKFFNTMAARLEVNPRIRRELGIWDEEIQKVRAFDFILMVANDELATYLEISAPVTNIVQERPEYTNINGGLGLWASRTLQGVYGIGYKTNTIKHLQEGDETAALNFCSPSPFSDYSCE